MRYLEIGTGTTEKLFERFDDFYYPPTNGFPSDKRYQFSELELTLVPEESTRAAALRAGEADIGRISLSQRDQVESGGGHGVFSPESVCRPNNTRS